MSGWSNSRVDGAGWSKFGVDGANLEWVEQIWSGWSKFAVGGTNLEWVEHIWSECSRCGQNSVESTDKLEKTLLCKLFL